MEHSDKKELKKRHFFCINIKSDLIIYLKEIPERDLNLFLMYLYEKYKNRLLNLRNIGEGTCVAEYQPRGVEYKRIKIRGLDPLLWQRYWELRMLSGYSISYIIRVFLEWEILDSGRDIVPILPAIRIEDERLMYSYPNGFRISNSYVVRREWYSQDRTLFLYYWDDA